MGNNHAEGGVALIQQYCRLMTKDKQQLQFLLGIVQEHRKNFPDSRKKTLMQYLLQIRTLNIVEKTITIAAYRFLRLISYPVMLCVW